MAVSAIMDIDNSSPLEQHVNATGSRGGPNGVQTGSKWGPNGVENSRTLGHRRTPIACSFPPDHLSGVRGTSACLVFA
jgi:hypothetical protein